MIKISQLDWMIAVLLLGFVTLRCSSPPTYSDTPYISLVGLKYTDGAQASDADTLTVSLNFQDGDGNLGLGQNENKYPYNEMDYLLYYDDFSIDLLEVNPYELSTWKEDRPYNKGVALRHQDRFWAALQFNSVEPGTSAIYWREVFVLNYASKKQHSAFQNQQAFVSPYNCTRWRVVTYTQEDNSVKKDTVAIRFNPNHYNIFIEFYVKDPDGSFSLFDPKEQFTYPNCVSNLFNGRFPVLYQDLSESVPLSGVIQYKMRSTALSLFFDHKVLKLKISIQDKSFNMSNQIETAEFTLQSIK